MTDFCQVYYDDGFVHQIFTNVIAHKTEESNHYLLSIQKWLDDRQLSYSGDYTIVFLQKGTVFCFKNSKLAMDFKLRFEE